MQLQVQSQYVEGFRYKQILYFKDLLLTSQNNKPISCYFRQAKASQPTIKRLPPIGVTGPKNFQFGRSMSP